MKRLLVVVFALLAGPAFGQSHPVFFQRASDLARFAAMKANYDANPSAPTLLGGQIYKHLKTNADSGTRYMDFGQLAGDMYMISCAAGACDSSYVTKAWTQLTGTVDAHQGGGFLNRSTACTNSGLSGNYSREFGWQLWLLYDQIYSGLSGANRTTFLNKLNAMAACVTASGGPAGWNFRADDTDQTGGDYFQMAMMEVSTGSYNTTGHGYWADSTRKLGGFTATAADGTNYRNAVKKIVTDFGADGEWMESSEYNYGTTKIYLLAAEAMRSAQSPTDNYPEITTWQADGAEQFMHVIAPGITNSSKPYQWGDVQAVRDMQSYVRFETCLALAGLTSGTSIGPKLQDFCMDWLESAGGGNTGLTAIDPYPRGFLIFDGAATRGDHTTVAKSKWASGEGIYSGRTGWTASDTAFWVHMPRWQSYDRPNGVAQIDHAVTLFGEFQMMKTGVFAITHPIAYGPPSDDSRGSNNLTLGGVPAGLYAPAQYKSMQAHEDDDTNGFLYITGTQGGSIVKSGYFGMPTNFIMEHTRSIVWLKGFDLAVVHDRANAKAPVTTGYPSTLKTWMDSRPRKELYVASPVSPTQTSNYLDWIYSGTSHTRVTNLLPASIAYNIESDAAVYTVGYYAIGTVSTAEKKYHTIITPTDQSTQFHTFLNVWDAYATGTPATVTLVQDATNKVDCALVTKGADNRLACFNAVQGQDLPERTLTSGFGYYTAGVSTILDSVRKRTTSYTVTFTVPGGSSTTKALLFDLDISKTWSYTINGSGGTLTPDSQGVGVIDVSGTGSKTLVVTTSGIATLAITTTSPLTNGTQNVAYSTCIVATGGLQPYTWSKTGSLPAGLSLGASTGCITGTPSGTGASSVSITVQDSQGSPASATLNPTSLTIDAAATPTIITTTSLSDPTVNVAFSGPITVTGGTGVYTCSLVAGQPPTGLSVSSNCTTGVNGTPTVADEAASFTVRACDNAGSPVCDDQDYSQRVQFTNTTPMQLQIVEYADDVVYGYYGNPGLTSNTSCTVTMTGQADQTTTTGASRRTFLFTGLNASTSYDITASCVGVAFPAQRTITTRASTGATTSNHKYSFRPTAALVAQGVAKMEFYAASSPSAVNTAVGIRFYGDRVACTTGCSVIGTVPQGLFYYKRLWTSSGDAIILSGPMEMSVVP